MPLGQLHSPNMVYRGTVMKPNSRQNLTYCSEVLRPEKLHSPVVPRVRRVRKHGRHLMTEVVVAGTACRHGLLWDLLVRRLSHPGRLAPRLEEFGPCASRTLGHVRMARQHLVHSVDELPHVSVDVEVRLRLGWVRRKPHLEAAIVLLCGHCQLGIRRSIPELPILYFMLTASLPS